MAARGALDDLVGQPALRLLTMSVPVRVVGMVASVGQVPGTMPAMDLATQGSGLNTTTVPMDAEDLLRALISGKVDVMVG